MISLDRANRTLAAPQGLRVLVRRDRNGSHFFLCRADRFQPYVRYRTLGAVIHALTGPVSRRPADLSDYEY